MGRAQLVRPPFRKTEDSTTALGSIGAPYWIFCFLLLLLLVSNVWNPPWSLSIPPGGIFMGLEGTFSVFSVIFCFFRFFSVFFRFRSPWAPWASMFNGFSSFFIVFLLIFDDFHDFHDFEYLLRRSWGSMSFFFFLLFDITFCLSIVFLWNHCCRSLLTWFDHENMFFSIILTKT